MKKANNNFNFSVMTWMSLIPAKKKYENQQVFL